MEEGVNFSLFQLVISMKEMYWFGSLVLQQWPFEGVFSEVNSYTASGSQTADGDFHSNIFNVKRFNKKYNNKNA